MKISWQIEQQDIKTVRDFINSQRNKTLVQQRIHMAYSQTKPRVSRSRFWQNMVSCLLTTQQRSGPTSAITRFINTKPFRLRYDLCRSQPDLRKFAQSVLSSFGGIRRSNSIAAEMQVNLALLEAGLWKDVLTFIDELRLHHSPVKELEVANFIDDYLKGFGPKQARNLLQSLGLTRYEIPIDSRITKWLNSFNFPVKLSAQALSDRNYYRFVSEGFQQLCAKSKVFPTVLDAAIFVSFDKEEWSEESLW